MTHDPSGLLTISRRKRSGVWAVFFRQRLEGPAKLEATVRGWRRKGKTASHGEDIEILLDITVTP